MIFYYKYLLVLVTAAAYAASENLAMQNQALVPRDIKETNNDLKTSSSSYSHQYSDWGGNYPGGYGFSITGTGTIDDKSGYDPSYNTISGYDTPIKNNYVGFGNNGYSGITGYGSNIGSGGYKGYTQASYGPSGYSPLGYGISGYGPSGLEGSSGNFGSAGYGVGNGGYGGYGGNGGLNSYYGYNNPNYQGAGHLGYGYYNKKPGYGNIYSSGITPSLVTGYRGYTRR